MWLIWRGKPLMAPYFNWQSGANRIILAIINYRKCIHITILFCFSENISVIWTHKMWKCNISYTSMLLQWVWVGGYKTNFYFFNFHCFSELKKRILWLCRPYLTELLWQQYISLYTVCYKLTKITDYITQLTYMVVRCCMDGWRCTVRLYTHSD